MQHSQNNKYSFSSFVFFLKLRNMIYEQDEVAIKKNKFRKMTYIRYTAIIQNTDLQHI